MPERRFHARVIRPIPGRIPTTLVDTMYPGKVFEFTPRTFVSLPVVCKLGDWTCICHRFDLRIDGRFEKWDHAGWALAICERLRRCYVKEFLKLDNPATDVTVSLCLKELGEIWLYKSKDGVARANMEADLDAIRSALKARIAAVPMSGRTDCMRQAALCPDDIVAIRCKQRDVTQLPFLNNLEKKFIA